MLIPALKHSWHQSLIPEKIYDAIKWPCHQKVMPVMAHARIYKGRIDGDSYYTIILLIRACKKVLYQLVYIVKKFVFLEEPLYSVSHIITYPSKELCSKMALGEGGVSLP